MAKKITKPAVAKTTVGKAVTPAMDPVVTPVRNSAIPPRSVTVAAPAKKSPPTYDAIALRAYFIWKNGGGSSFDNWIRAERELSI